METLSQYIEQLKKDLTINESNVREASMLAPSKKHFWAARLIQHKLNIRKLEKQLSDTRKQLAKVVEEAATVTLNERTVKSAVDDTDVIKQLQDQIADEKLIVEFLEKAEKTLSSMTYDLKNVIEVIKIEQT